MANFVLVHGGSHGSWCWDPVAPLLTGGGHVVRSIDLPGRRDANLDITLDDWVNHLEAEIDAATVENNTRPTLVAHSMGGITASQLLQRRPDAIESVIFVGAVAPEDGQSGLTALSLAGSASELLREGALLPSPDGRTLRPESGSAKRAFYNRSPREFVDSAIARLCPEYLLPLSTPLELGKAFRSVPKRWIATSDDRVVPLALQEKFASQAGAAVSLLDADHSPFFSAPKGLAALLVELSESP